MKITMLLNEESTKRIKKLIKDTQASGAVEVISRALRLYEHTIEKTIGEIGNNKNKRRIAFEKAKRELYNFVAELSDDSDLYEQVHYSVSNLIMNIEDRDMWE